MKRRTFLLFVCSIMLVISTSGCDKLEEHSGGLLVTMSLWNMMGGNCVMTKRQLTDATPTWIYFSVGYQLPKVKCHDTAMYYIGADQAQAAVDKRNNNPKLAAIKNQLAAIDAQVGGTNCTDTAAAIDDVIAIEDAALVQTRGSATAPYCYSLTSFDPTYQVVWCIDEFWKYLYADRKYTIMSDVRADIAFRANYVDMLAPLALNIDTNGLSTEAIDKANTFDPDYATAMFAEVPGKSFLAAQTIATNTDVPGANAAGAACNVTIGKTVDSVKKQLARGGADPTYDITANYVAKNVTSAFVADYATILGNLIPLPGLHCCRDDNAGADCGNPATYSTFGGSATADMCGNSTALPAIGASW